MDIFTVAFFGHRYIDNFFTLEEQLEKLICALIEKKDYVEFLVGRNGDFDQLASSAVIRAKKKHGGENCALVLVLPYVTAEYINNQNEYERYYDNVEISYKASAAFPQAAIQIRNREMADRADLIICFVDCKSGGAYQTVKYAKKVGKRIINLADFQ